jgi:hypothetical protein
METKSSLTLHYIAIHACDERIMHTSSMTITQTRFQWMATKNLEGLNSPVLTPLSYLHIKDIRRLSYSL